MFCQAGADLNLGDKEGEQTACTHYVFEQLQRLLSRVQPPSPNHFNCIAIGKVVISVWHCSANWNIVKLLLSTCGKIDKVKIDNWLEGR